MYIKISWGILSLLDLDLNLIFLVSERGFGFSGFELDLGLIGKLDWRESSANQIGGKV